MDRECMNVVYASNDGYARHLGTSLYSLLDRNRDFAEISVYVLTLGLSEENQGKLREIAEHFGRRLIFLNLDDLLERIGYEVDTGGFDISVMLRLFMGDMLPESVERVIKASVEGRTGGKDCGSGDGADHLPGREGIH